MRLYVDLETLQLIEGPGFRNPVSSLRFKRGDAAQLEVTFLTNGTTPATIGDPSTLELQFGIKPRGRYDVGYLVHETDWTLPDPGAESPVYLCSPSFNTVELDSALGLGSSNGSELAEITLMGEITWRVGTNDPTSTRTFLVVVENDVNRGDEGAPTDADPTYPAASAIELVANKGVANGYASLGVDGKVPPGQLPTVYGQVYSAVSVPSVQATTTDPVTIASVTLPNGTYHIEALVCSIHGAAGGVELGLASDHLIRVGLLNLHGKDEDQMTNTPVVNDGTNLITRAASGGTNYKSQWRGILQVFQGDTTVRLTIAQFIADTAPASTRKRAYLIAQRLY